MWRRSLLSFLGFKRSKNNLPKRESGSTTFDTEFDHACNIVVQSKTLSNDQLLQFYGLYKQATFGDNNRPKQSAINIAEAAKWDAWRGRAGLGKEDAKKEYIKLQKKILGTVDSNDPDDLFMPEEEYLEMRKNKIEKGAVGTVVSKGSMLVCEEVPTIEESENNDVHQFFLAIEAEELEKIQQMIKNGFNLKQYNSSGITGLHYAVDAEKPAAFELRLEYYEDCNVEDINGETPLHFAVTLENKRFIKTLLAKNADPNKPNKSGETPADRASESRVKLIY